MDPQEKLHLDIKRFLEVYRFMPAEVKAHFEAKLAGDIKNLDEKSRKLYSSLLRSAKEGKSIEDAIKDLG
ncbi:MAG: hypothetical protein PHH60_01585 [Candidatus Margulisbacteria bacterium]|nr:hypothetical protein [Candidatus Margulisiibacteriota bacterium]